MTAGQCYAASCTYTMYDLRHGHLHDDDDDGGRKKKKKKRRVINFKTFIADNYCRRFK